MAVHKQKVCVSLVQLAASERGALGYKLLIGLALGALAIFYACLWMYYQYHLCVCLTLFFHCLTSTSGGCFDHQFISLSSSMKLP